MLWARADRSRASCNRSFSAEIQIELLKSESEKGYHSQLLYFPGDELCYQVKKGGIGCAQGIEMFVPHSFIFHHSSEYITDGCLRVRVREMAVYSTPNASKVPSWRNPCLPSQSLCEFTLPHFSRCKALNLRFQGPSFYTHPQGYKMFLRVHANGKRKGFGSHLSVSAQLMKGEFDDSLEWPFKNDVAYELVNWRGDRNHRQGAISFGFFDERVCTKVSNDIGLAQYGYLEDNFIPHTALTYNSSTNTQYLQDDCLFFRVTEVAVYSTPSVPKILSWQDPTLPSQSAFELTLNEFSKRKRFNNEYYSTPFFTHPQGYKIQLEVRANGEQLSVGAGSHVSIYARLIRGEYDDDLHWPLSLDLVVQLLNYRRNDGHIKRFISFRQVDKHDQVTTGVLGPRSGFPQFVAHASLAYNPSTGTEYLQSDCLRFSVDITILSER